MNQVRFFKATTIFLVVLNVAVISFLLFRQGPSRHHPPFPERPLFEIIEHKLKLDDRQKEKFKSLREEHHEKMMELDKKRDRLLKHYFKVLTNPGEDSGDLNELMDEIKQVEQQRIEITYAHFNDIKELCNEEQIKIFPEILNIAIERLLTSSRKGSPPQGR